MFDWLDLKNSEEHRQYALSRLEEQENALYDLRQYKIACEQQVAYIDQLKEQVSLLQKTLDLVTRSKQGGVRICGRAKNVCKNHHR